MILQLKKDKGGNHTLSYVREDGTRTWMHISPYFVLHDLLHYAIENVLGFDKAFMGLVAAGKDLTDFERGAREWLPVEAIWAEVIAGAIQSQLAGSATPEEFAWSVAASCEGLGIPAPPSLSEDIAARIIAFHAGLLADWRNLPGGAVLELHWPNPVLRGVTF
jgi:hypothetical protein